MHWLIISCCESYSLAFCPVASVDIQLANGFSNDRQMSKSFPIYLLNSITSLPSSSLTWSSNLATPSLNTLNPLCNILRSAYVTLLALLKTIPVSNIKYLLIKERGRPAKLSPYSSPRNAFLSRDQYSKYFAIFL